MMVISINMRTHKGQMLDDFFNKSLSIFPVNLPPDFRFRLLYMKGADCPKKFFGLKFPDC